MAGSRQPAALQSSRTPSDEDSGVSRSHGRLPTVLSTIAGMVDVIGYLSLGLFTAHVTGNVVVIAALLVRGGPPKAAQILAVPVFMVAVAAVWLIVRVSDGGGPRSIRALLLVQFLLLSSVLIFSVIHDPASNPHGSTAAIAAMIAVSAMGCQFALLRIALPGAPSTAVMTGNLTNTVLSLLDTFSRSSPVRKSASQRLNRTLKVVAGFFGGCVVGAAGVSWLGKWAWCLPVVLAGAAVAGSLRQSPR